MKRAGTVRERVRFAAGETEVRLNARGLNGRTAQKAQVLKESRRAARLWRVPFVALYYKHVLSYGKE